ncbi:MAG: ABC transporter permease [Terracidiphilus sp.]
MLQDLRYAVRQLVKSPGFTLAAILTLTIGIGANTAVFSNMDAVVLHPLAVPRLDRVVTVASQQNGGVDIDVSLADFADFARQNRSFEQMAVYNYRDMSLTGTGDAAQVRNAQVSAGFFEALRAQPLTGRLFLPGEFQPGQSAVVVLNYGFWKRQFAADPGVLGRTVELDQHTYTVVGVLPKAMQYPSQADFYLPLAPTAVEWAQHGSRNYTLVGRLREGVTVAGAQAELSAIAGRLSEAYPATNRGWSVHVAPLLETINGDLTPLYYRMVLGATLFVLLVVCANVANLQFARSIARRPEIAMRTALGASRSRLVRQLLTENILLGLLGAAGGIGFAALYLHIILITMPLRVSRFMAGWSSTSLNGRVLVFSLLLAVGAGVLSGIVPALAASRVNLASQLKAGARNSTGASRNRLRSLFAVVQIVLAVALVIGAALISKGMNFMLHRADVYSPGHTLIFNVNLPEARYGSPRQQAEWYARSLARLRALPGVSAAEVSSALPLADDEWFQDVAIENRPVPAGTLQNAARLPVSPGYFAAFHIPILEGRGLGESDGADSLPVAVVSRTFAERYLSGTNPIGHRIRLGGTGSHDPWVTIVGISADTSYSTWFADRMDPAVYLSVAQLPSARLTYAVFTSGDPLDLAPAARTALAQIDPALPLDLVMSFREYLGQLLTGLGYASAMLALDALIALLLAAIGIFAVMANQVGERTREIGVRLAMGARRQDILSMVLTRAAWLTAAGLGAGLALAFVLARLLANLFRGVRPDDPLVFSSITAVILAIAFLASWLPARRAARIEPMAALRDE